MTILVKNAAVCGALVLLCGCSIKRVAINKIGNMLASGGSTFTSDDDPELVEAAIPFGLKTYESLLAESPKHTGLLLAAARASPNTPTFRGFAHRRSPRREPGTSRCPAQPRAPALYPRLRVWDARPRGTSPGLRRGARQRCR